MKTSYAAAIAAALTVLAASAGHAQTLVDRYSFNNNGNDSVNPANSTTPGANVTYATAGGDTRANFVSGTGDPAANYASYQGTQLTGLVSTFTTLQNSTFEFYVTADTAPAYAPMFAFGNGNGFAGTGFRYFILSANRNAPSAGVGFGASIDGYNNEVNLGSGTNLSTFPNGFGVVDYVFSGFSGAVGSSTGTVTIYVNGVNAGSLATLFSPAYALTAGTTGAATRAGIGGGSVFNDPSFGGGISEFRIYNGALSAAQISANIAAGPNVVAPEPSQTAALGLGVLGLVGLAFKARKRQSA